MSKAVIRWASGPVIRARTEDVFHSYEALAVGEAGLLGEVIQLSGDELIAQVYEDTTGLRPGDPVTGTGAPLSVRLGPGLLGGIFDGLLRPLAGLTGFRLTAGASPQQAQRFHFKPLVGKGDVLSAGQPFGRLAGAREQPCQAPPGLVGTVLRIVGAGEYADDETLCELEDGSGQRHALAMTHTWPVRRPRPCRERRAPNAPMITGQRIIDTLFPVARGSRAALPGGFGTGKTILQEALAKWCDADVIVYIGCGERGNEITDVLREFPAIIDPRTGRSLMERTVLIANTSNMPVSAREASIYTGATMAEYFRDMGLHVAVMADSTSRWAEALRELSGRMEEMPAEEGFPAYLPTRIAEFYERAGYMKALCGREGSVTMIGAVSPPGGDFSEPVTQHTKRFIRCFWGLDRQLANARHYPAISWLDSYSEYLVDIAPWWEREASATWEQDRHVIMDLLQREVKLQQVVKLVGPDALPDSQRFILEVCTLFKNAFLQQNAFDKIDMYSTVEKQTKMLNIIVTYYERGAEAIKNGATLIALRKMKAYQDIIKMKFSIPNDDLSGLDKIAAKLERSFDRLSFSPEKG
jgi:V/A-type H+-transporting ATPase subunit A